MTTYQIQSICRGHHDLDAEHSIGNPHIQAMTKIDFFKYLQIRYPFISLCIRNFAVDGDPSRKQPVADTDDYAKFRMYDPGNMSGYRYEPQEYSIVLLTAYIESGEF